MFSCTIFQLIFSLMVIKNIDGLSSPLTPYTNYTYSIELLANTSDLWWTVDIDTKEITFELHMNTTGWIALGISPAGGMPGADIGVGWVDQSGNVFFQDRYAYTYTKPVIDNTTTDWFALQGREENGWTAIQFKRLLDTCDSMDVPIKSGTNILIFAWGLVDPEPPGKNGDITYHENRRGQLTIPLQSYSEPPSIEKFAGLDRIEFRVNNYTIPSDQEVFYCQIFKVPNNFTNKRHVIAREILIDSDAQDVVYHLTVNECDPTAVFDDNNLPYGNCDDNVNAYALCTYNIIIAWAVGGDYLLEYPEEVGLPIGLNFSTKYYMIQINYYNGRPSSDYADNSGVRFYVGNELRPYDIGAITFGVESSPLGLAIPPNVNAFSVDTYCTADASLSNFPNSGLTVISAFDHTHLQGVSMFTKVIRNKTAVQYLFNAESYDPNHQFEHRLPQPIQLYPGDEFATRCVYNTINKTSITLGGRRPDQEMCVQVFYYYPRVNNLYTCASEISPQAWQSLMNVSASTINEVTLSQWLLNITWTSDLATQWQTFYNTASRMTAFGSAGHYNASFMASLPTYQDLNTETCDNQQTSSTVTVTATASTTTMTISNINNTSTTIPTTMNTSMATISPSNMGNSNTSAVYQATFIILLLVLSLINGIII